MVLGYNPRMPRTIAVVCARMGSERLPGKTLRPIGGRPMLGLLLDRARGAKSLEGIVVASPESPANDAIEEFCRCEGVACFRGSEDDVTGRMLGALEREGAEIGVQLYGDSPLVDPRIIDRIVEEFAKDGADWVGNDLAAGYPSGFFAEAFSLAALREAAARCFDPAVREHGTLCLRRDRENFRIREVAPPPSLNRPELCLSIDGEEDMQVVEAIVVHFAPRTDFPAEEIVAFLDANPEVAARNRGVQRRWRKYQKQ